MKILAIEKELNTQAGENIKDLYKKEALTVYNLYKEGTLREIHFNQDKCAIIILECESIPIAASILDHLPLVQKGLISFELHALSPYTGYDRLIEPPEKRHDQ